MNKVTLTNTIKTKPYKHQELAFQVGITLDQSALLMEQGTGKTLAAIGVAGYRYQQGQIKKLLIVAPLSVISVWHSEFLKHADFPYRIVDLTDKDNDKREIDLVLKPRDRLFVALINYESAWRTDRLLIDWEPDMIIADESQKIKNGQKKQSKALYKLGKLAKYKMILTGTPITQGPLDIWSQYRFLNSNIFGTRYTNFRDSYAVMGGYLNHQVIDYQNLEELTEKTYTIAYRVLKSEALDLPETIDQDIIVNLSGSVRSQYKEMEKNFIIGFENGEFATAPIILTQLLRLQQITGGFITTEEDNLVKLGSAKLEAIKDLLIDLPAHKKVVIFARFRPEIQALSEITKSLGIRTVELTGSVKSQDRGKVLKAFQTDPNIRVILVQIQTGGLGITLTAADTAIFYSTTFSFADYEQAKARLHRIGQHHSVTYIHIITGGTIDEEVTQILRRKGSMAGKVLRDDISRLIAEEIKSRRGITRMIGLDDKPKGGWFWDEETGRVISKEGDYVDCLGTAKTLEEAKTMVSDTIKNKGGNLSMAKDTKKLKKSKKTKKLEREQKAATPETTETSEEETPEEAGIEELEELVTSEAEETPTPKPTKKSKKALRAEKKAAVEKPVKEKKAAKVVKETPAKKAKVATPEDEITVKELAAQLKRDPKELRKILRTKYPDRESRQRWVWKKDSKELERIIKVIEKASVEKA